VVRRQQRAFRIARPGLRDSIVSGESRRYVVEQPDQIVMQPMQWAQIPDVHDIAPLSELDADCLRELREVLRRHDALGRFAVSLIHKHFDMQPTEQMVEFTDPAARTLTIKPISSREGLRTLETTWRFSPDSTDASAATVCVYRCFFNANSTPQHVGQHAAG
jgi:hypothetical protein